uniref:Cystein-Rich Protein (CRP) family 2 n=2 Tax=uncultured eukaryote TaxID=100272 RepID=K7ZW73_9EUKA|nr:Cystein-Rich Protein (CRP) family 2 [uncultured eukaryote]
MATCCCKIPKNVTSEACCPPTCCPRSGCVPDCKTETCKNCGCCAMTCPCCASLSGHERTAPESRDLRVEGPASHPQCECASTVLEDVDKRTKCGCPLIVVCGCDKECETCKCKHECLPKTCCTECPQKQEGGE